jgi:phosphoglycolate phosphatase
MSSRLAIFDCDGTLVDSHVDICRAMEDCFLRARLEPPPREATRRVVGLSLVDAIAQLLPSGEPAFHAALAEDYKRSFHRLRAGGEIEEPLFEGMLDLLHELEAEGWLLGIATGKSDRGLRLCLERHGIHGRFITLQTADRHPSKPHPAMIEAALDEAAADPGVSAMIGDTSYDMAMAKAAGVTAIGVGWGYHDAAELLEAGADFIAEHPADILAYMKALA